MRALHIPQVVLSLASLSLARRTDTRVNQAGVKPHNLIKSGGERREHSEHNEPDAKDRHLATVEEGLDGVVGVEEAAPGRELGFGG